MSDEPILPRRQFLATLGAGAIAGAYASQQKQESRPASQPASAPAESNNSQPAVPEGIDLITIAAGGRLAKVDFTEKERSQILKTITRQMAVYETVRSQQLKNGDAPAEVFDPRLAGFRMPIAMNEGAESIANNSAGGEIPATHEEIAFASVGSLSNWLRKGKISSVQLTKIYLERLKKYGPKLECVITLTESLALQQAAAADREIAAGKWRGPLHGIPYGLKDLFDTKGIATTWGAESYQNRVPDSDATIVQKLQNAGAVLVAKLTLGALAYGDIWFGGQTKNPWNLKQGSSGSSAGSASAVAAGLVGFAIGTETWGSISSPSARCGIVGFRPTFGRVSRHGAMALCWSLDKVGPLTRTVDDAALVFAAIAGVDTNDAAAIDAPVFLNFNNSIEKIKIGFVESEYSGPRQTPYDRNLLEKLRELKADVAPISIPKEPYAEIINMLISVEGAAAFDEMTRANQDDLLKWQADNAWPNTFRMTRLVPAVEYMQARRVRRKFMKIADDLFKNVDAIIAPASHGDLHALTNMTGQPALTLRIGRRDTGVPICATLWAPLFRDEQLLRIGRVIEEKVGLRALHPKVDW